jgi:hypothetical protein
MKQQAMLDYWSGGKEIRVLATNNISADLPTRIQKLLEERQHHESEIAHIDEVLESVYSALSATAMPKRGPGRPAGTTTVAAMPAPAPTVAKPSRGRRRSRGSYATTGDDSVLAFIKANKSPTTKDIKAHWASEGRGGTADNVLSKLYREKTIKRLPLHGERGSRYMVG